MNGFLLNRRASAPEPYGADGQIGGFYPTGSDDFLTDSLGESFFAELRLDSVTPQRYEAQARSSDGQ